jgi:hypothetical protein
VRARFHAWSLLFAAGGDQWGGSRDALKHGREARERRRRDREHRADEVLAEAARSVHFDVATGDGRR